METTKFTRFDYIIVITLIAIMIVGLSSALGSISVPQNDLSNSPETPFHVTPYFSRISRIDTLVGFHSQIYFINYKFHGYIIYVNVHSPTELNLYLYSPGNVTVWSMVNITTLSMATPEIGSSTERLELGQYRVIIQNPTVQTVKYLIVIELQPIG